MKLVYDEENLEIARFIGEMTGLPLVVARVAATYLQEKEVNLLGVDLPLLLLPYIQEREAGVAFYGIVPTERVLVGPKGICGEYPL